MYAPTSLSSPRSGPTSGDDGLTDFDGAGEILRAWGSGLRPDPDLTVSEWADRHRMLSGRASAEPGRYRTVRTPYMREIMDRLSPGDPTQRVVFMKAAQVGATEAGNNWIGFVMHHAPGPMLAVQPTVELAKRNSRQRIDPLIDESPELRERVKPARSRDAGNTMLSKEFAGGILIMTGANSAVGLRSTPARYIFLDEVDAYPASADEEGDPVTLAEARSLTFAHRRKVLLVSTPTIRGLSRIEREYEASDQRRYFVPCPHCGHDQWLKFDRLRWQKGRPETAEYHCEGCETPIAEHHKTAMLEGGEWRATAVAADPTTVGYHLSALYSPIGWLSWERIARAHEAARGNDETMRAFRNTILGETWVETGEAPDWQRLYDRREAWTPGTVPAGGLFLTAGADVQKDRIEVDVWAWGRGLESWLVDHVVIEGGPDRHDAWSELTALLGRSWPHERGAHLRIARLAIDTGYEAPAVYSWSRAQGFAQVSPVKGVEGFNRSSPVSGPTFVDATEGGKRLRRGARLWTVAVSTFKAETYRFLRLARPTEEGEAGPSRQWRGVSRPNADGAAFPPGSVHLPQWANTARLSSLLFLLKKLDLLCACPYLPALGEAKEASMSQMRTIEIDFDVHQVIELERTGFEENPNDALRRLLKLPVAATHEDITVVSNQPERVEQAGRPWAGKGVELPHGTELRMEYRGQVYRGQIEEGEWVVDGKRSKSPSDAAGSAAITKNGGRPSLNGWIYWEVKRPQDANWRKLKNLKSK